jgi:hypothetical protein
MTTGEIQGALADFYNEAAGDDQGGADSAAPEVNFEPVTAAPLADSAAGPEPQGSSLDSDTLKKTASEREEAEELLRSTRRAGRMTMPVLKLKKPGAAAQPNSDEQPQGVAVRVLPSGPRKDAPGPGAKVHIIDPVTKKVTLTQG